MIHFGQMRCGKVDQCGRLFFVVTEFFHVNFVPLLPLRSFLVMRAPNAGRPEVQVPVPLSVKSVLMAWLRTLLVLLILFSALQLFGNSLWWLVNRRAPKLEAALASVVDPLALVVGFAIFLGLTYRFAGAGRKRATELAARLGLSEDDLDAYRAGDSLPAFAAEPLDADAA